MAAAGWPGQGGSCVEIPPVGEQAAQGEQQSKDQGRNGQGHNPAVGYLGESNHQPGVQQ